MITGSTYTIATPTNAHSVRVSDKLNKTVTRVTVSMVVEHNDGTEVEVYGWADVFDRATPEPTEPEDLF